MAVITVSVDDEVYGRFRKIASEEKSGKKGFLGDTITDTMKKYVEEKEQDAIKKRLLALMKRGVRIGFMGYKSRSELYEARIERILAGRHKRISLRH